MDNIKKIRKMLIEAVNEYVDGTQDAVDDDVIERLANDKAALYTDFAIAIVQLVELKD